MLANVSSMISNLFSGLLWFTAKAVIIIIIALLIIVFSLLGINYIYMRYIKKDEYVSMKPLHPQFRTNNSDIIKNIFINWPRAILKNNANPDRNHAYPFGTFAFVGAKGTGKSMGMVRMAKEIARVFPDVEIAGNLSIFDKDLIEKHNYRRFSSAKELFSVENSKNYVIRDEEGNPILDEHGKEVKKIYPMLFLIDEAQNAFASNRFGGKKNEEYDERLLSFVADQRKLKNLVFFSTQRFHRVDKKMREQIDKVYKCFNIAGWMWQVPYILKDDESQENTVKLKRTKGFLQYVRTQELCDAYDTTEIIKDVLAEGFKSSDKEQETSK